MIAFAPAKINIGLKVLNKRPDGYHNLDSIFYPIPIYDIIEFTKSNQFEFMLSGLSVDSSSDDNLVFKAYHLMRARHDIGNLHIHLHKMVPSTIFLSNDVRTVSL